jgi:dihydropteroate synthase
VYVGLSRKSMIATLTGRKEPADRAAGSVAAALIAVQRGARMVRVHDVAATVDALKVWHAVQSGDKPERRDTPKTPRWPDDE